MYAKDIILFFPNPISRVYWCPFGSPHIVCTMTVDYSNKVTPLRSFVDGLYYSNDYMVLIPSNFYVTLGLRPSPRRITVYIYM